VPARDYAPAGPLRLAAPLLAAQVAWLLPLAVIGGLAAWRQYRGSGGKDWALLVWAGWAAAYGAVFSAAEALFHAYYLAVIAAPLCALAAIGFFVLWQLYRDGHKNGWLLPAALLVTAAWQGHIVQGYLGGVVGTGFIWLPAFSLGAAGFASVMLWWRRGSGVAVPVAALVFLLALPTVWSVATAAMPAGSGFTAARPPFLTAEAEWRRSRFAMAAAGALAADPRLLAFLARNHRGEQFSLATANARMAAPIIIATGTPVMALGGFNGRAPILKVDAFAELVADGRVRFALIGDGSPGLRRAYGEGHQKELVDWIRANGKAIDPTLWRSSGAEAWSLHSAETVGAELYDLSPLANGGA
jgi:4-amino-4-deoxy-L-arabinose transferase-like glycosyltransferase